MQSGLRSMPVLPSRDVAKALAFWRDMLGFEPINSFEHEGRLSFAILRMGQITIALQHIDSFTAGDGWSAYLYVTDVASLAATIKSNGVALEHDLHETFYGMKEFDLRTPDGHGIAFGQDMSANQGASGL